MDPAEPPLVIQEWVKAHPIFVGIAAIILFGAIIVFAVRYGDLTERW